MTQTLNNMKTESNKKFKENIKKLAKRLKKKSLVGIKMPSKSQLKKTVKRRRRSSTTKRRNRSSTAKRRRRSSTTKRRRRSSTTKK
jgi:hypothetical protein